MEKLLVELKNDSIFLSNYNFNGWYGKWFCNFKVGATKFENGKLQIKAKMLYHRSCSKEEEWQKIEYQLIEISNEGLTLIKILDTTNCDYINSIDWSKFGRGNMELKSHKESEIQLR